jgi:hypothetical protein
VIAPGPDGPLLMPVPVIFIFVSMAALACLSCVIQKKEMKTD